MKIKKEYWLLLLVGLFTFLSMFRMNVLDLNTDVLTAVGSSVATVVVLKVVLLFLIGVLVTIGLTGFVYRKVSKEKTNSVKILEYIFITAELELGLYCTGIFDLAPFGYVLPIILLFALIITVLVKNEKLKSAIITLTLIIIDAVLICLDLGFSNTMFVAVLFVLIGAFISSFIKNQKVSRFVYCAGFVVSLCIMSYTFGYDKAGIESEASYNAKESAEKYKYEHQLKANDTIIESEFSRYETK